MFLFSVLASVLFLLFLFLFLLLFLSVPFAVPFAFWAAWLFPALFLLLFLSVPFAVPFCSFCCFLLQYVSSCMIHSCDAINISILLAIPKSSHVWIHLQQGPEAWGPDLWQDAMSADLRFYCNGLHIHLCARMQAYNKYLQTRSCHMFGIMNPNWFAQHIFVHSKCKQS